MCVRKSAPPNQTSIVLTGILLGLPISKFIDMYSYLLLPLTSYLFREDFYSKIPYIDGPIRALLIIISAYSNPLIWENMKLAVLTVLSA